MQDDFYILRVFMIIMTITSYYVVYLDSWPIVFGFYILVIINNKRIMSTYNYENYLELDISKSVKCNDSNTIISR